MQEQVPLRHVLIVEVTVHHVHVLYLGLIAEVEIKHHLH